MLYQKYKPLASRVYCAGLALLLVLSEVFSSNLQSTLPTFSRVVRLGLTGFAVLLLAGKIVLLTEYETQLQKIIVTVVLVYTAFRPGTAATSGFSWLRSSGWGPRMWICRRPCGSTLPRRWPGCCWCRRCTLSLR